MLLNHVVSCSVPVEVGIEIATATRREVAVHILDRPDPIDLVPGLPDSTDPVLSLQSIAGRDPEAEAGASHRPQPQRLPSFKEWSMCAVVHPLHDVLPIRWHSACVHAAYMILRNAWIVASIMRICIST